MSIGENIPITFKFPAEIRSYLQWRDEDRSFVATLTRCVAGHTFLPRRVGRWAVVRAAPDRGIAGSDSGLTLQSLAQNLYYDHLPTSFERFRCELNRKKSKFERYGLLTAVTGCAAWIAARSRSAYNCNAGNLEQARMMAESQPQMAGGTVESRDERHLFPMLGATTIVLLIAACKLVVHLYAGHRYGYLGDELYFLACSRHLAWGYVDQPPLIAMIAWAVRNTLGQSLLAIRFLPALAGAVEVVLTALIARELGGRRFAQVLAAITTLTAPGILGSDSIFTMNAFEPLFWMTCAYLVIRIIKTGNERLWIWFGVVAGIGLENKYSMMIFGAGIVLGLLLTNQRKLLANRWLWIGGVVAFVIFAPNLWWNVRHHFPFLELQANIRRSGRNVPLGFFSFFGQEIGCDEPVDRARVAGRPVVFLVRGAREEISRAGLGLGVHSGRDRYDESARVLPLSRLSAGVRRRQRPVGNVARGAAAKVGASGLPGTDDRGGRDSCAARHAGAAGRNVHSLHARVAPLAACK